MKIHDVTVPLTRALPTYPGDPPFEIEALRSLEQGHPYRLSRLSLGTHTGTHVDAPAHLLPEGAGVDELPLEILVGKARVVDLRVRERIERADLEACDLRADLRLLLRTRMSGQMHRPTFQEDHVHLTEDAAAYLVQAGLKLVGIDYLSIDAHGSHDLPAHRVLLSAGVVVVEGLDLSEVEEGEYEMICLPLRIPGGDGAPARVLLKERP